MLHFSQLPCICLQFPCRHLYGTKIVELRRMEDLWRNRRRPEPLDLDVLLLPAADGSGTATAGDSVAIGGAAKPVDVASSACRALGLKDVHAVWDVPHSAAVFLMAVQLFVDGRSNELGSAQVVAGIPFAHHELPSLALITNSPPLLR